MISLDQTIEAKTNRSIPNANMPVYLFTKNNLIFTKLIENFIYELKYTRGAKAYGFTSPYENQ